MLTRLAQRSVATRVAVVTCRIRTAATVWERHCRRAADGPHLIAARRGAFRLSDEARSEDAAKVDLRDSSLPRQLVADEVVKLIAKAERYIERAPDYGGLLVTTILHKAGDFLSEAEDAARLHGILTNALAERITTARKNRVQMLYDLDLL